MNKELLQQALDALVSASEHTMPDGYKHLGAAKRLIQAAIAQPIPPALAKQSDAVCFVQFVPAHCDRIIWKNNYYHLPIA